MRKTTLIILAISLMTVSALAQAESTEPILPVNTLDLLLGGVVSFAVASLKKIPFVEKHPKLIATGLSLLITAVTVYAGARGNSGIWPFVISLLTQLAAAIGTHELLTKPVKSFLSTSDDTIRRG